MKLKSLSGNLQKFHSEFIVAGPRDSIVGLYRKLEELGAEPEDRASDNLKISSKNNIVILCINDGKNKQFARIKLCQRSWWDYWHNPRNKQTKPAYKTYNFPRQLDKIAKELFLTEIPELVAEEV